MDTYFAPAERASQNELVAEIEIVSQNPVLDGLLHSVSGLLAILNEQRQLVALNDSVMQMLGIHDPEEAFGLRPGEALQCIHAHDEPSGCGTTKFCSTCGAAVAMVTSLGENRPAERMCALTATRGDTTVDLSLSVKSHPIKINKHKFLLLFLQDITLPQQRAALERTFFHDINNILNSLLAASELLALEGSESNLVRIINQASLRLHKEVAIQSCLLKSEPCSYLPMYYDIMAGEIVEELKAFYANDSVSHKKNLEFSENYLTITTRTDISLLLRVLCNMITNALEATDAGGTVKIWVEQKDNLLSFCVWNRQAIPQDIALRIFQRNFSTKEGAGRGVGTYSMKLFGEKILGGQVSFTTSGEEGTVFKISLPS
jgi:K+-sensing histidine kinase KdpD